MTARPPHPIHPWSHALVERIAEHQPSAATWWGIADFDDRWEDLSPSGVAHWASFLEGVGQELDAMPAADHTWDRLAIDVARAWLEQERSTHGSQAAFRHLGHIATPFQMIRHTLHHMPQDTTEQREAVRARLAALPTYLDGYRAALSHGIDIGERVGARQVQSCVAQGRNVVARRLLDQVPGPDADRAHHAFAAFTDWLEETYLPAAKPEDGVGEHRYQAAAGQFLHAPVDLDDAYAWGWTRVHELHAELVEVIGRVSPGRTLADTVQAWRTDPSTTARSPDAFLERVRGWQEQAMALLGELLPVPEVARTLEIERAPAGLPPGAWYSAPSEHADRPGTITYSLGEGPVPLFDQQSTACHEGFPGHHLQLSIERTLQDRLSRLHRLVFQCMGYAEGWALYAERLVDEHGGYDDDVQRAGYLVNQIARACRVVLDIGLHTGRAIPAGTRLPGVEPGAPWTFERAVAFMTHIGGLRPEVSHSEITRYLGWPGQAISYALGQRQFLTLRRTFLARGHSLATFHDRVLGSGTLGLGQLSRAVLTEP